MPQSTLLALPALMFWLASCGSDGDGAMLMLNGTDLRITAPTAPSPTASAFSAIGMKQASSTKVTYM